MAGKDDDEAKIAVVLIHGIGEQTPLDTLRAFVAGVLRPPAEDADNDKADFWSKPDAVSGSFDLRRFRSRSVTVGADGETRLRHAPVDFYEYYWAHKMAGSSLAHTWQWLSALLRRPGQVPPRMRGLWVLGWVLVLALAAGIAWLGRWQPAGALALVGGGLLAALKFIQAFALRDYLGDAARYFSPVPGNIAVREDIRRGGVELLRRLHESGDYHRVIVVGHSLGSAIALDLLYHYWTLCHGQHGAPDKPQSEAIERLEAALKDGAEPDLETLRALQLDVWRELRANGVPWRVTDLITIGSPLTHFPFLIGLDPAEFAARKDQREIPVSPPVLDDGAISYPRTYRTAAGKTRTLHQPHHAALFAACRWTNLYFPHSWVLRGDPIGGPLQGRFGNGILDRPVSTRRRGGWFNHTDYWHDDPRDAGQAGRPMAALKAALAFAEPVRWGPREPASPAAPAPPGPADAG